jgi:preprotein translocase subunit YajC
MNLLDFLIAPAYAQAAAPAAPNPWQFPIMMVVLFAIMYFLMIRPQMKRQKEHRAMVEKLAVGDEVLIGGGIAGVVRRVGDSFVTVEIADKVEIRVQKNAIGNVLPKGSLKSA